MQDAKLETKSADQILILRSEADVRQMLDLAVLADNKEIAVDTETSSLKWWNGVVSGHCIGFSIEGTYFGYYIPVRHTGDASADNIPDAEKIEYLIFDQIYGNPDVTKVLFNLKFDKNFLLVHKLHLAGNQEDAMLLAFLANENEPNHRLKTLLKKYIDPEADVDEQRVKDYVKNKGCGYDGVPVSLIGPYGAKDAIGTLKLWRAKKRFVAPEQSATVDGVRESIYNLERSFCVRVVSKLERTGFPCRPEIGLKIAEQSESAAMMLAEDLYYEFNKGKPVDLNSNRDVNELLVGRMGFKAVKSSPKTGEPAWGRGELLKLDHPVGEWIAAYRNLAHGAALARGIASSAFSGRIFTSYNQIGAKTGRASSSEPNLQQVPNPKRLPKYARLPEYVLPALKEAFELRKMFVAPEGYSVLSIDESQFELRLLDHYAQDPVMHQAFEDGKDVHVIVACMIFDREYEQFMQALADSDFEYKINRTVSKEMNFAKLYGAGIKRLHETILSYGIKMSYDEVRRLFWRYNAKFSKVREFVEQVMASAKRRGWIFNYYGRHKRVPGDRTYAAVNWLIQGGTADMLKDAALKCMDILERRNAKSYLSLMVHDEIDFILHDDEHDLIPELKAAMQDFPWCRCPIIAEASLGPNWLEQKELHV